MILTKDILFYGIVAFILAILLSMLLGYYLGRKNKNRRENIGEAAVRKSLTNYCKISTAHLLNNVTLEYKGGTTQIDHILITQNGIIVIETKHYSGWLFAHEKQLKWTQVLFKVKHRFLNPLIQNKKHIMAVQQLLDFIPKEQIRGLVIFTGDAQFKTEIPRSVIHLPQLEGYVDSIRYGTISENRVQFCVGRIEYKRLELTGKTDIEHQRYLDKKFGKIDAFA